MITTAMQTTLEHLFRAAIQRRIKYFQSRVRATMPGTAAHTRARNLLRVAERMLLCYKATGSVAGWHKYHHGGQK